MFIQTEETPNPAVMKFLPGRVVLASGTAEFCSKDEAEKGSELASALFGIEGIASVFYGADFISIAKLATSEWDVLKPPILGIIMEHFITGRTLLRDEGFNLEKKQDKEEEDADPIVRKIKELLDERVRPAVAQDGGDIVFHGFDKGVVYLTLRGACAGCPSASATLKMGVENLLRHYIPEVSEVRARI